MKKEIPPININKTKFLKLWVKGESYKNIGLAQTPTVSKQAMQQRILKEISEIPEMANIIASIETISKDAKGGKYPFLSFSSHPQGRLLAHIARHELGYSIIAKIHCSLETIGQAQVKTKMIKSTKSKTPVPVVEHVKGNPYAYMSEFFLLQEEPFAKYFEIGNVDGKKMVVALNADTMLYTVCSWMKNRPKMSITDILDNLTPKYKKSKKINNIEDLQKEAIKKVRHIYSYDDSCKRRLLDFIGVHESSK